MIERVSSSPIPSRLRDRLIEREKQLIVQTEAQRDMARNHSHFIPAAFPRAIGLAKKRLQALQAGLIPIRIAGRFFPLPALLNEGQYIPPQIGVQAKVATERLPGGETRVYGWDREALPAERRRRDPELTYWYGGAEFWLGYWREVDTHDDANPEFFGFTTVWAEKRGRGRPRKALC